MQYRALLRIACSANRVAAREIRGAVAIDVAYVGKLAINEDFIRDNIAVASATLVDRRAARVPVSLLAGLGV